MPGRLFVEACIVLRNGRQGKICELRAPRSSVNMAHTARITFVNVPVFVRKVSRFLPRCWDNHLTSH